MIEIEKKFFLTRDDKARLIKGAEFLGKKMFADTYYDSSDYTLTTRDMWLRSRDNTFHLKVSARKTEKRQIGEYHELETEEEIRKELGMPSGKDLKKDLTDKGYIPFASFITTRRKYKRGEFTIDLDMTDFGYEIGEIELLVRSEDERDGAIEKIFSFARSIGLPIVPVNGKVIQYIYKNNLPHYKALIQAGVLSGKGTRE